MGKRLTDEERIRIIELRNQGKSIRQIAREVGRGRGTVERVIKLYNRKDTPEDTATLDTETKEYEVMNEGGDLALVEADKVKDKDKTKKEGTKEISNNLKEMLEGIDNTNTTKEKTQATTIEKLITDSTSANTNNAGKAARGNATGGSGGSGGNTNRKKTEDKEPELSVIDVLVIAGLFYLALSNNPILQRNKEFINRVTGFTF